MKEIKIQFTPIPQPESRFGNRLVESYLIVSLPVITAFFAAFIAKWITGTFYGFMESVLDIPSFILALSVTVLAYLSPFIFGFLAWCYMEYIKRHYAQKHNPDFRILLVAALPVMVLLILNVKHILYLYNLGMFMGVGGGEAALCFAYFSSASLLFVGSCFLHLILCPVQALFDCIKVQVGR